MIRDACHALPSSRNESRKSKRGARIRTGDLLLPKRSKRDTNHGRKSRKSNWDCTICASCRWGVSGSAGVEWREYRVKWRAFGGGRCRCCGDTRRRCSRRSRLAIYRRKSWQVDGLDRNANRQPLANFMINRIRHETWLDSLHHFERDRQSVRYGGRHLPGVSTTADLNGDRLSILKHRSLLAHQNFMLRRSSLYCAGGRQTGGRERLGSVDRTTVEQPDTLGVMDSPAKAMLT